MVLDVLLTVLGLASFELVKCSSFHCTWRKAHSALLFFCPISVVTHLLIGGLLFLSESPAVLPSSAQDGVDNSGVKAEALYTTPQQVHTCFTLTSRNKSGAVILPLAGVQGPPSPLSHQPHVLHRCCLWKRTWRLQGELSSTKSSFIYEIQTLSHMLF